jgi:hypothetical protein
VGPTQRPIQQIQKAFPWGSISPESNAEVKRVWSFTSPLPPPYAIMAWRLIKHKDNLNVRPLLSAFFAVNHLQSSHVFQCYASHDLNEVGPDLRVRNGGGPSRGVHRTEKGSTDFYRDICLSQIATEIISTSTYSNAGHSVS